MADKRGIVDRLRACENDPMWANHAEIPKSWCKDAADEIERLRLALWEIAEGGDGRQIGRATLTINI